jgi:ribosomal protein L37AE/L43A
MNSTFSTSSTTPWEANMGKITTLTTKKVECPVCRRAYFVVESSTGPFGCTPSCRKMLTAGTPSTTVTGGEIMEELEQRLGEEVI